MTRIIGKGKFLRLVRNGKWEYVERANASGVVAIVALTNDRRIVLTEQFRTAVGRKVIDLPAGLAGDVQGQEDEALSESALRELMEETGYRSKQMAPLATCPTSPGLTSELVTLFLARNLQQVHDGGGVDGEQIEVHTPSLRGIDRWLALKAGSGVLIDTKVFAGLYFAKRRSTGQKKTQKSKTRR